MKFNVKVERKQFTKFNQKLQDWSGDVIITDGFNLGKSESNNFYDVLELIQKYYDVEDSDITITDDGQLTFSIVEDANGLPDANGEYLTDYFIVVEKIEVVPVVEAEMLV
ncbi:hypothetical protein H2493_000778 [Staphylococcus pseudintermedius]|uniref:Uncharacterized protein n=1 Tax=Staphylococcus pseudintermedius TaxID=283734 RepID=A0A8H9EQB6_STAPS|nr:hypothetical protein [Staphylococcus pseudintermedius]EGQ3052256.1 hypothetical protein [Staphylococcus pseudintermedius]EGQ3150155.1 hypothetical protein [Staphylococcus pseudintermedius]EGQ3459359.1 hypothetical protein [Staphylococcus pseudintermedius]EGQ3621617.1 hypothetical protein [Staphylococcus pseudintermedius]EGQ3701111.1 hypothetical protein [Staphylococcus pseudintermedius]